MLADNEKRIVRMREGQLDCDSEETTSSEDDSEVGEESEDEGDAPRLQQVTQTDANTRKGETCASYLRGQPIGRDVPSGCWMRSTAAREGRR